MSGSALPDGFTLDPPASSPPATPTDAAPPADPLLSNALNSIKDPVALGMALNAANQAGLPKEAIPAWVSAIHNESGWDLDEQDGTAGEIGPGQIKPETGADMGFTAAQLRDPQQNLTASATYFGQKWAQARGNDTLALTGYNAGSTTAPVGDYAAQAINRMSGWVDTTPPAAPAAAAPPPSPLPPGFALDPAPPAAGNPQLPPGFVLDQAPSAPASTAPAAPSTPIKKPPENAGPITSTMASGPDAIDVAGLSAAAGPAIPPIATSPAADRPYLRGTVVRPVPGVDQGDFKPTAVVVPGQTQLGADAAAAGQGLASGAASAVRGAAGVVGGALTAADSNAQQLARAQLGVMNRIDAGEAVPAESDPLGYGAMSLQQRQAFRTQYLQQLQAMPAPGKTPIGVTGAAITGAGEAAAAPLDRAAQGMPVDTSREGFQTAVARGVGNLAPAVAAGLTPGGVAAVAGVIGAQSFDSSYRDAVAHGADQQTAYQAALTNGLVQAGIMSVPLSRALMRISDPILRDGALKTAVNYATHGVAMEGAAEAGRFADNYVASQTYDPTRNPLDGIGSGIGVNLALGLLVPAAHGAGDALRGMVTPTIEASPELQNATAGIQGELARVQQGQAAAPATRDPTSSSEPEPAAAPPPVASPESTPPPAAAQAAPSAVEVALREALDRTGTRVSPEMPSVPVPPDAPVSAGAPLPSPEPPVADATTATSVIANPIDTPAAAAAAVDMQTKIDGLATAVAAWRKSALDPTAAPAQTAYGNLGAASRALSGMRQYADRVAGTAEVNAALQALTESGTPLPFKPAVDYQGDDARRAWQAEPRMPGDLASVITKLGGVRPETTGADNLRAMDLNKRPAFFNRNSRFSVEQMATHLQELGYLGDQANDPNQPDVTSPLDVMMQALDLEKSGAIRYSNRFNEEAEQNAAAVRAYTEAAQHVADRLGLSPAAAKQLTRGQVADAMAHFGGDYSLRGDDVATDALRNQLRATEPSWASLPAEAKDARIRLADTMQTFMRFAGLPKEMGLRLFNQIADEAGNEANARYSPHANAIDFALDTDWEAAPQKFFHEIMHPMLDLLPRGQQDAVRADAYRWLGASRRIDGLPVPMQDRIRAEWRNQGVRGESNRSYLRRAYSDAASNVGGWDAAAGRQLMLAEAVSHMAEDTYLDMFTPKLPVVRAIGAIGRFLDGIGNALAGEGFHSGQGVIRAILSGERAVGDSSRRLRAMAPRGLPAPPAPTPVAPQPPAPTDVQGETAAEPAAHGSPTLNPTPPSKGASVPAARTAPRPAPPVETPTPTTEFGRTTAQMLAPRDPFGVAQPGSRKANGLDGSISGASDSGAYSLRDPLLRDDERVAGLPGFYSPVARAALDLKQARGSGEQMLAMITKASGVKPEETRWLGLDTWLRGQPKVTREQVLDYIRANSLDVRETLKGAPADAAAAEAQKDQAVDRLSDLVARDGATSGPPLTDEERAELVRLTDLVGEPEEGGQNGPRYASYALPGGDSYRELLITLPNDGRTDYDSDHWDEPNVLAHTRFTERVADDGARTLMIEEAQSDWHQSGRKNGYRTAPRPPEPERMEDWGKARGLSDADVRAAKASMLDGSPNETYLTWRDENAERTEALSRWSDGTVPDAPFKTTWPSLIMKRMIRWAVDNGFDRVAWSPGDVHAERYDLSKQISRIELQKTSRGLAPPEPGEFQRGMLEAFDRSGKLVIQRYINHPDELANVAGKEVAQRLLDAPERVAQIAGLGARMRSLSGLELHVGGDGMRGFYDKILPAETNKLIGRFGAKVERGRVAGKEDSRGRDVPFDVTDSAGNVVETYMSETTAAARAREIGGDYDWQKLPSTSYPVHSFNITPAMREAVLRDGMPLFSLRETMAAQLGKVTEARRDWAEEIKHLVVPIATGSTFAQASAARFANFERDVAFRFNLWDKLLQKRFTPAERRLMWDAMDDQSLFEIELKEQAAQVPQDQEAELVQRARDAFTGHGLDRLTPEQRDIVIQLDALAKQAWSDMQARGLVEPGAEGLPFYSPRFFVSVADDKAERLNTLTGRSVRSIDPLGLNINTNVVKDRAVRITADSLRAMRANYPTADLVRDIRVLPVMLAREQRAVAATDLIRAIKEYGDQIGIELVSHGVPTRDADSFVTIPHPALQEMRPKMEDAPDGSRVPVRDAAGNQIFEKVPIQIHKDFEGPLRAVLRGPTTSWYHALMALKRLSVGSIMYSPLIHLQVELGRTAPLLRQSMLNPKFWQAGNRMRTDPDFMSDAIMHGLAPIGGTWASNVTDIYNEPSFKPGVVAKLLGKYEQFHQWALWDRIQQMQVGIYSKMRDYYIADGHAPGMASYMAAHLANRYAGALPREALSNAANMWSNIGLFSRSYTLGNLGALKDATNGMPSYVRAQMAQEFAPEAVTRAKQVLRREAQVAFAWDVAMYYAVNSLAQNAIQYLFGDQTLDKIAKGYVGRALAEYSKFKGDWIHNLNPFGIVQSLAATGDNEPGKENRIGLFRDARGSEIYVRNPVGKVSEDGIGWLTNFLPTLRNKLSPQARFVFDALQDVGSFGRPLYDEAGSGIDMGAHLAKHFVDMMFPTDVAEAGYHAAQGLVTGKNTAELADALKFLGPTGGLQFSHGFPGGPDLGFKVAVSRSHNFERQDALPDARGLFARGDEEGARQLLTSAGMTEKEVGNAVASMRVPDRGQGRQNTEFNNIATPEQKARLATIIDSAAPSAAAVLTAAQRGVQQANDMFKNAETAVGR